MTCAPKPVAQAGRMRRRPGAPGPAASFVAAAEVAAAEVAAAEVAAAEVAAEVSVLTNRAFQWEGKRKGGGGAASQMGTSALRRSGPARWFTRREEAAVVGKCRGSAEVARGS